MASIIDGFEYDIFISYRHKDNKGDHWVTEFVNALKTELESTFKENISIYFDENPHDGLQQHHEVDDSLKEKLKSLIFIPIISQTYCDPKAFAWAHELIPFIQQASEDTLGLKTRVSGGNIASRVLPVKIHDIDNRDKLLFEEATGSVMRSIDFIYKETGVNRPLRPTDDRHQNQERTDYRNQVNKVANAVKDILQGLTSRATGDAEAVTVEQAGDHSRVPGIDASIRPKIPVITFSDQLSRLVRFSKNFWRPVMLGLLIAVVGWSGYWMGSQWSASPITRPVIRYELPLKSELGRTGRHGFKISRDGKHFVFVMREELMLKTLDANDPAVVIPNTLGARHPFFSPDGEWIGFADHTNGRIMKIRLQGSNLSKICDIDIDNDNGMNWYDTEVIFSSGRAIYRVPEGGGVPTLVYPQAIAEDGPQIWNPQFLPGKKYMLFNESDGDGNWDIMIWKIGSTEKAVVLIEGGFDGRYLNSGHLAYTMGSQLYVSQFDISSSPTLSVPKLIETKPIYILDGVYSRGSAQFDFSDNGLLAYYESRGTVDRHLVWIDRSGVRTQITAEAGQYSTPAISHDGRQIALGSSNAVMGVDKIELVNPALGTSIEFVSTGVFPVWSPDNSTILYSVWNKVFEKPLNLSYEPRLLLELQGDERNGIELGNLSSDGRFLLMSYGGDIGYLDRQDTSYHKLDFINSNNESFPSISPDGKWLAYVADFRGKSEVYVAPFPGPGQLHKISSGESYTPMWSPDMKSIYLIYQGGREPAFMEVQVSTANGFSSGKPVLLFTGSFYSHFGFNIFGKYDIHPRGDRFLGVQNLSDSTAFKINMVVNWQQMLENK